MLAGRMVHNLPWPMAFCTGQPCFFSLSTQHPGQGCRIPLEKPVPWRAGSEWWGLTRLQTKEVGREGLGLPVLPPPPSQHPQPQLSVTSLLSSWMWSVLFSLNRGPPCLMMSSVATLVKASSTLLESLAEVSMAQRMS